MREFEKNIEKSHFLSLSQKKEEKSLIELAGEERAKKEKPLKEPSNQISHFSARMDMYV